MRYKRIGRDAPSHNAAYSVFTLVIVVVEGRNEHLQRCIGIHDRGRNSIDDSFEQWLKVDSIVIRVIHCHTVTSDSIEYGRIEVRVSCCQFQEQILSPFEYLVNARITTV